ncbi:MAG: hypothetical protein K0A99_08715 [Desulfoarculaceae bacterium]|nr:hypothetical protein [Desulfoarculaceae bacterium]
MQQKKTKNEERIAGGPCLDCGMEHSLSAGDARSHCRQLMQFLENEQRIDLLASPGQADPRLSTASLFGKSRGKMFGIMVCRAADGSERILRAFSGQYNGLWELPGWSPPLFDVGTFTRIYVDIEPRIKQLGRELELAEHGSSQWRDLTQRRRQISRQWMQEIHALYLLHNFRGQQRLLSDVFGGSGGIPTGTGDCCAPKLLNQAVKEKLIPLGLAEFYWGRENASQTRQHSRFHPSCASKCVPILGFMLCGLEAVTKQHGIL